MTTGSKLNYRPPPLNDPLHDLQGPGGGLLRGWGGGWGVVMLEMSRRLCSNKKGVARKIGFFNPRTPPPPRIARRTDNKDKGSSTNKVWGHMTMSYGPSRRSDGGHQKARERIQIRAVDVGTEERDNKVQQKADVTTITSRPPQDPTSSAFGNGLAMLSHISSEAKKVHAYPNARRKPTDKEDARQQQEKGGQRGRTQARRDKGTRDIDCIHPCARGGPHSTKAPPLGSLCVLG
jgi:hypothetical protein